MPQVTDSCAFFRIKQEKNNQFKFVCVKKHSLLYSFEGDERHLECSKPTTTVMPCPDYKKGLVYTWAEMKTKLGWK